ncbi:MAG: glycosyltransferase family 39 protein [Terracidiphilus sp.]|nr:glycosyltransferase family 39 protein [Terracidiphilus sp.]
MESPHLLHAPNEPRNTALARLPLIILVAFAIRMVVVFFTYRDLPDADKFYEAFGWEMGWIARAMASGHGFSSPYFPWSGPTAMQPPLYPTLLSLVFRLFGIYSLTSAFVILSINSLLSSLTCIPVYFSAKYSIGRRAAIIAATVWALYPFAIYFSAGRVWEYSLTGLLFTTSFCIAQRIHRARSPLAWIGWGALVGLTALSNPATLSTFPFLLALALYQAHKSGSRWLVKGALTALAAVAVLTPWTIRNVRAVGVLCPVRDNFWLEVYDDNGGDASLDPSFAHPSSNPDEMRKWLSMGEAAFLAEKRQLAIAYIRQHPMFPIEKTIHRFFYYWTGYWSLSMKELHEQPYEPGNIFQVVCMTTFMLLGIRRRWRTDPMSVMPYLVLICFFPITYYITHPLMDYRQPIEPAIIVLAVAGALPLRLLSASQMALRANQGPALKPTLVPTLN